MLLARPFFLRKPFHHYIQPIKTLLVRYAYELVALDDTQMGFGHFTQVPNGISHCQGLFPHGQDVFFQSQDAIVKPGEFQNSIFSCSVIRLPP